MASQDPSDFDKNVVLIEREGIRYGLEDSLARLLAQEGTADISLKDFKGRIDEVIAQAPRLHHPDFDSPVDRAGALQMQSFLREQNNLETGSGRRYSGMMLEAVNAIARLYPENARNLPAARPKDTPSLAPESKASDHYTTPIGRMAPAAGWTTKVTTAQHLRLRSPDSVYNDLWNMLLSKAEQQEASEPRGPHRPFTVTISGKDLVVQRWQVSPNKTQSYWHLSPASLATFGQLAESKGAVKIATRNRKPRIDGPALVEGASSEGSQRVALPTIESIMSEAQGHWDTVDALCRNAGMLGGTKDLMMVSSAEDVMSISNALFNRKAHQLVERGTESGLPREELLAVAEGLKHAREELSHVRHAAPGIIG